MDASPQEGKGAGAQLVMSLSWFRVSELMPEKELPFGYSCSSTPILFHLSVSLQDDNLKHFPLLCSHSCHSFGFSCNSHQGKCLLLPDFCWASPVNQYHLNRPTLLHLAQELEETDELSRKSCLIIILITVTSFANIPAYRVPVQLNTQDFLLFLLIFLPHLKNKLAGVLSNQCQALEGCPFSCHLSLSH